MQHVVLGGTGGVGSALVRELMRRGEKVTSISRQTSVDLPATVQRRADACDYNQLREATKGADVLYNCINVPSNRWSQAYPALMHNIVECAKENKAVLVHLDSVQVYGKQQQPVSESSPYLAADEKGTVRARTANYLLNQHRDCKLNVVIGRSSDIFGPGMRHSVVGEKVFDRVSKNKAVELIGNPDVLHTHTYVSDVAKALIILGQSKGSWGQVWHLPSTPALSTRQFVRNIAEQAGSKAKFVVAPAWVVSLLSTVQPSMKEFNENMHHWQLPLEVNSHKFSSSFPLEATPLNKAIQETLLWYKHQ